MISAIAGLISRVLVIWSAILAATKRFVFMLTDYQRSNPITLESVDIGGNTFIKTSYGWIVQSRTSACCMEMLMSDRSGRKAIFQELHAYFGVIYSNKHGDMLQIKGNIDMGRGGQGLPCNIIVDEYRLYLDTYVKAMTGCLLETEVRVPYSWDGNLRLSDLVKVANNKILPLIQGMIKERTDGNY